MAQTRLTTQKVTTERKAALKRVQTAASGRSAIAKPATKKSGRVQWNPQVAVKGRNPETLNDASATTVEVGPAVRTGRPAGRPRITKASAKTNIRTVADLPKSPTESTPPESPPPAPRKPRSNFQTFADMKRTRPAFGTTFTVTKPRSSSMITAPASSSQQFSTQHQPIPRNYADRDRRSLVESVASPTSPVKVAGIKRRRSSSAVGEQPAAKVPHTEFNAGRYLNRRISEGPAPLRLSQVGALFDELKKQIREYAFENFRFELSQQAAEVWPMHHLADRYLPLMRTTQYIADGSQYGWQTFFTMPDSRAALVYGVIGEYVWTHIFEQPSFGLDEGYAQQMADIDAEYLHYDAIPRAKRRSKLLSEILDESQHLWDLPKDTAVADLARTLLSVLTPLLPPGIFTHDPSSNIYRLEDTEKARSLRFHLELCLKDVLRKATALSWGLILTGANGTIFRLVQHLEKGTKWYGDYDAPQNCINPEMIYRSQAHGFPNMKKIRPEQEMLHFPDGVADIWGDEDLPRRPLVKMTCFPRLEMVVPHGPDHEELAKMHALLKEQGLEPSSLPSILPDGTEVFPIVPDMVRHEFDHSKHGPWNEETMGKDMRHSYVDIYPHVSKHDVYLENNYRHADLTSFMRQYRAKHSKLITPKEVVAATRERQQRGRSDPDDDDDNTDGDFDDVYSGSDSDSDSDSVPCGQKSRRRYRWNPGHSNVSGMKAFDVVLKKQERKVENMDAKLGWKYVPLETICRRSLRETIDHACLSQRSKQSRSARQVGRISLAAHEKIRNLWNTVITPNGGLLESGTVLLVIFAAVCYRKGWDIPGWACSKLSQLRDISTDDLRDSAITNWEILSHLPGDAKAKATDLFHGIKNGSLKMSDLLPSHVVERLSSATSAAKSHPTKILFDNQGNLHTSKIPHATTDVVGHIWQDLRSGNVFIKVGSKASSLISTMTGTTSPKDMLAAAKAEIDSASPLLTTAVVKSTSTSTSVVTATVSTNVVSGVVGGLPRTSETTSKSWFGLG